MATRKKTGTVPAAPIDRVQMISRNPDGSARQTDEFEIVGPLDVAERAAREQLTQLHVSNADQAHQRERLAASGGGVGDSTPDDEVQARIDHHRSLAEHAASQAASEMGSDDQSAESAQPTS